MKDSICHLNELEQEHRCRILEKFLSHFIEKRNADESSERKPGHIRIVRELNIIGTRDPTLKVISPSTKETYATLTL